jgi:hypothetical protein
MNRKQYLLVPVRLALLSLVGLTQVMLVMFGCLWVVEHLADAWPWVKHLRSFAALIGFTTLVYPVYILMAMENPKRRPKENVSNKASQVTSQ